MFGSEHRDRLFPFNEDRFPHSMKHPLTERQHPRKRDHDFEQRLQVHERKGGLLLNGSLYLFPMQQIEGTQMIAERKEMLLAEISDNINLQCRPLHAVERTG